KQTGSFYTPREIVNYMVDESIKAYIISQINPNDVVYEIGKDQSKLFAELGNDGQQELHINESSSQYNNKLFSSMLQLLLSYGNHNPFADSPTLTKKIIQALNNAKII